MRLTSKPFNARQQQKIRDHNILSFPSAHRCRLLRNVNSFRNLVVDTVAAETVVADTEEGVHRHQRG